VGRRLRDNGPLVGQRRRRVEVKLRRLMVGSISAQVEKDVVAAEDDEVVEAELGRPRCATASVDGWR
jgi:hypothetical protein